MKRTCFFACLIIAGTILPAIPGFAQPMSDSATNENLVRDYYKAYETKDWHIMERILAADFTFSSPAGDDHIPLKVYKARCWPNSANTKKFDLEKLVIAGDDAFATYNGWTNDGAMFRNTERFRLKDGKIEENECFFGPGVHYPNNEPKK
jgi:hypothetical protein